jgi:flagellar biosynthesis protein FlhG
MNPNTSTANPNTPTIIAVGGGKGGVGKSVVSTMLALFLARMGKETILMDVDLGGANIHTLLGIKSPLRTINDFVTKKYASLEDVRLETGVPQLNLISGVSEVLSLANLQFAQKAKIIQHLRKLNADYIVLDLGGGTTFNVLDFFLVAHKKLVVMTSQPTSIQNAYAFVRNAVYRHLSRLSSHKPAMQSVVREAMDPKNELQVRTINELFQEMAKAGGSDEVASIQTEIAKIQPALITNMVMDSKDRNASRIIQVVAEKYLMIQPTILGSVAYDRQIHTMVTNMVPLAQIDRSSEAFANLYDIVTKLINPH